MATAFNNDEQWMQRCFDLARQGVGYVSPNPPVGAVLVHNGKIIGEGFHPRFGGPHAEVVTLQDVKPEDRHLVPLSTLYVSLEPCCIHSKTPPCTDLIIKEDIRDIRISVLDPNPAIAGKGIDILKSNGVQVISGIMKDQGNNLIKPFRKNILHHQPYVVLKWAQSHLGFIGTKEKRILISHPYTATFSHQLRAEADVILVGARTVMIDNPTLTTRSYPGRSPHRAIYDPNSSLRSNYQIFQNDGQKVFYFSLKPNDTITGEHIYSIILDDSTSHADQILEHLFQHQMGNLLVEGGSFLLNMFIRENLWDEAWVIRTKHPLNGGISAPIVKGRLIRKMESVTDTIIGIENETKKFNYPSPGW